MDPDGGFVAAFERRRMRERGRDCWDVVVDLVPGVLVGLYIGLFVLALARNARLSHNLDEKEMQLAKASADLLHREAELARANLLWTQVQLAEARGRSDLLGSGEGGMSPPSRSYAQRLGKEKRLTHKEEELARTRVHLLQAQEELAAVAGPDPDAHLRIIGNCSSD